MVDANAEQQREFKQRVRTALRQNNLVICAGSGATLFATANASGRIQLGLTWSGLIQNGFSYIEEELLATYDDNKERIEKARAALSNTGSETDEILSAAQMLADILQAIPDKFSDWLSGQFGKLDESFSHPEIHDSLKKLHEEGAQLMTTNYDGLIEHYCGLKPLDASQYHLFPEFNQRQDGNERVFHPHGEWQNPGGIVLDIKQYYQATDDNNNDPVQGLLLDIFRSKTVLFVGCGPGTGDHNFTELLKWLGRKEANLGQSSHYILLRNRDCSQDLEGLPLVKLTVETVDDIAPWLNGLLEGTSE